MYGESILQTYMTIFKVDSQWEFAVCLRELKQGLCINLEGWDGEGDGREFQKGRDIYIPMSFPCVSASKDPSCSVGALAWSVSWEVSLEKGKCTHSNILAWRISWTVWSMGSQRVRHDWATFTQAYGYLWLIDVDVWQETTQLISSDPSIKN